MASVKKYPFYTDSECKSSLSVLMDTSWQFYIIADVILHTGAELSDVLSITNSQMLLGETFIADGNPKRSVSLAKYRKKSIPAIYYAKLTKDATPFFQKNGDRLKESNVRSTLSKLSAAKGVDVSLIRFQKTFFLDYMIKGKSRFALKEVASSGRINEFCNENWIKEYLGLSDEEFWDITNGKWAPIIDVTLDYSVEHVVDACVRLEDVLKELKNGVDGYEDSSREEVTLIIEEAIRRIGQIPVRTKRE